MSIICFGSMNIDYVYNVDHILKPGETLESSGYNIYAGGKGLNQAIALGRAGADCRMAGMRGRDSRLLIDTLNSGGVDTSLIRQIDTEGGHTIIQVDREGQNCILYFGGANKKITQEYIDEVIGQCQPGDYILLQNEILMIPQIISAAQEAGLKIVLNPSPIDSALKSFPLEKVDLLILNEIEGCELTGSEDPDAILDSLQERLPKTALLLTLGSRGSIYRLGQETYRQDIFRVPVIDTTAAGDTFTGFFLKMLIDGRTIEECLRYAAAAAAIAVGRAGAAGSIPSFDEVANSNLLN
ncbi:MAG: ribokinase [Eubacteriales bacterium]|nr:ribokinase [Eubacteriales bacterium]MDD3198103.1 ribokinase [Eubacteriales bacterium]MDD4682701.1 ribokinase [Eubacteriales bacterium]